MTKVQRYSFFVIVLLTLALAAPAAQKVPIGFDDYHGYTGAVKYIKDVAAAYPNITELIETKLKGIPVPQNRLMMTIGCVTGDVERVDAEKDMIKTRGVLTKRPKGTLD